MKLNSNAPSQEGAKPSRRLQKLRAIAKGLALIVSLATAFPAAAQYTVEAGKSVTISIPEAGVAYGEIDGPRTDPWSGTSGPYQGTISYNYTNGSATTAVYTANANASGGDSFSWAWRCGATSGAPFPCGGGSASITVIPAKPSITGGSLTVKPGESANFTFNPTNNGVITLKTPPARGMVSLSGNVATYTAAPDYAGPVSFAVVATNAGGESQPATVNVTVQAPPAPSIIGGSLAVSFNGVGEHDFAPTNGGVMEVIGAASHGTVAVLYGGLVRYIPDYNFIGNDSFSVRATNLGGASAVETVAVTVAPPPVPVLNSGSLNLAFNTPGSHTFSSTLGVTVSLVVAPRNGVITWSMSGRRATYTPNPDFTGTDSFSVTATNLGGTSAPATVDVTVAPPPIPTLTGGQLVLAFNTSGTHDFAPTSGGVLAVASAPSHGAVTISGGRATYTPNTDYIGADSFAVTGTNVGGTSEPTTIAVTVSPPPIPTLTGGQLNLAFNAAGTHDFAPTSGGVLAVASAPSHGAVTISGGRATYTPNTDYIGSDSFGVTGTNLGGTSAVSNVAVTVAPPPIPSLTGGSLALAFNAPGTHDFAPTERGVLALVEAPAHGRVTINGGRVTYTPDQDYIGADSYSVSATNLGGTSAPVTASITVSPPAAPGAGSAALTTSYETVGRVILPATGLFTSLAVVDQPEHGQVLISGSEATYTPAPGYFGLDSFTYQAIGLGGTSGPASVAVTVGRPNAPVVGNAAVNTGHGAKVVVPLQVSGIYTGLKIGIAPKHGQAVLDGLNVAYTPIGGFAGRETFTVIAEGPGGESAGGEISVTVDDAPPVDPPPPQKPDITASPASLEGQAGSLMRFRVAAGLASVKSVELLTQPKTGTATVEQLDVVYAPPADFAGQVNFDYRLVTDQGPTAAATLTAVVHPPAAEAPVKEVVATPEQAATVDLTAGVQDGPFTDAVIISMSPASAGIAELVREAAAPRAASSVSTARGKLAGGSSAMATESSESFHLRFRPAENYFGEVVIRYGLTNRYAGLTQGVVRIMVDTRPDPTSKASVAATLNAQVSIAGRFSDAVLDNAGRRLEARRSGASGNAVGLSSARSSQDPFADPVKERWKAEMEVLKAEHDEHSPGRPPEGRGRAQVWVGGNVTLGEQRKAGTNSGFEFSTAGVSVGADTEIGDGLVIGAGIGLASDRSDLGDSGLVRATGFSGFIYGSWPINDALYLDGVLGGGRVDFKGERKDGAEVFESERSGQLTFAAITLGAAVELGGWSVDPYGGMRLSRARLEGYQEGGPAATALRFGAQDVESNSGVIGLRGRRAFKAGEGWLEPSFRGEYRFSGSETGRATVGYANGQEGVFYALELLDLADQRATLGAGLAWRPAGAWNFNVDVEQAWWERGLSTTLRVGAAGRF